MLKTTSVLAENMADYTNEAVSNAHDMDSTTTDLANAAANSIADNLHTILREQMVALAQPIGPQAYCTLLISGDPDRVASNAFALIIDPKIAGKYGTTLFGPNFEAMRAEAEAWIRGFCDRNRTMVAGDLGEF